MIGSGNVGHHLGLHLVDSGLDVLQVYSRTEAKAQPLAGLIKTTYTTNLEQINPTADLYLLAVSDSAIAEVAKALSFSSTLSPLVVHCSGATPQTVLSEQFERFGVFYPLQTFTKERVVDFKQIPICIDANTVDDLKLLEHLAMQMGCPVYPINDEQRAVLHLAAVFVNNFANHLFHIGEQILSKDQLPFDLLRPLIQETATKVMQASPAERQTGPAIRGDQVTIQRHLQALETWPIYREVYELFTKSIQKS
ncbi:MAG: hypothetical protein DHS20C18_17740 [Saprospiraceae bacterium]|nr:MAG: hypothetical protein DHS20C18_17740 [Saprospiraceae bacterium]